MKQNYYFLLFTVVLLLTFLSCSTNNEINDANNTLPSDLSITAIKVGANVNNPNGDGSGVVNFTITASNTTYYRVLINDETLELTWGPFDYHQRVKKIISKRMGSPIGR